MGDPAGPEPVEAWLVHLGQQGKSERTVRSYGRDLRDFARWYREAFGEDMLPSGVLPRDIEHYKAYLRPFAGPLRAR